MVILQHFNISNTDIVYPDKVLAVVEKHISSSYGFSVICKEPERIDAPMLPVGLSNNDVKLIEATLDSMYPVLVNLSIYQKPIKLSIEIIGGGLNIYLLRMEIDNHDYQNKSI